MKTLPALDLHAHIDPSIDSHDLINLNATIFAVTRSLGEAEQTLKRRDTMTIWGVGCHPRLVGANKKFSPQNFLSLIENTAFVGELGLDGTSRVTMDLQLKTLRSALDVLVNHPRILSLHSYKATATLISELEAKPVRGAVLHWWLGDENLTQRAIELGCYFSLNISSLKQGALLKSIPFDRILTETDHPFGDRYVSNRRPGNVGDVERFLQVFYEMDQDAVRRGLWHNIAEIVKQTGCASRLPCSIQDLLPKDIQVECLKNLD